ncbi:PASTA domain-containing protein [Mycolicibacter senuensis]|nr:PASTA domain-containing protein [Mycolicibacter senuensis]MDQ2628982.1 PASTA domain-containing protein [Actinomycetota bacterium]ORW67655.1 hypothetical protein AWC24_10310 [Mycolicibacter senuensis]
MKWPALVTGLLLAGAAITYLLIPPMIVGDKAVKIDPADLVAAQQRQSQPMPSLLGLQRDIAQTVLADAGLADRKTTVVEQPAAGPVGLIVSQQPSVGTADVDGIELTVSSPAPMPELVGKNAGEGRTALEKLGAVVQTQRRVDPGVPRGQIVETIPAAGEIMPTVVTLAVADPGDALTLASVRGVTSSSCSAATGGTVNGKPVGDSVVCKPGSKPAGIEYNLARNAMAFEATVGTDDAKGAGGATVKIFADDQPLATVGVGLGHSEPVHVDLSGRLRLRIEVSTDDPDRAPTVVLGDARLLGLPEGLDVIAGQR